jgi:hypothetical protein
MEAQWTFNYSFEFGASKPVPIVISFFIILVLLICVRRRLSSLLLIPDIEFNYLTIADSATYEIIGSRISKNLSVFLLPSVSFSKTPSVYPLSLGQQTYFYASGIRQDVKLYFGIFQCVPV